MSRSPFSLYAKRLKGGAVWYARFLDPGSGQYTITRSTGIPVTGKKGRKLEAHKAAERMLPDIHPGTNPPLVEYLLGFWSPGSAYLRHKALVDRKPLSAAYVEINALGIRKWVLPYPPFSRAALSDLTPGMIVDWQLWATENGIGPRRINAVMQAIRVPVRQAVRRGDLARDPFASVSKSPESPKERGVLSADEMSALLTVEYPDPRGKLAVLLGAFVGLRRGEARGLKWGDIDEARGLINVVSNYIDGEGEKAPKAGSSRTVIFPAALGPTLNAVRTASPYQDLDDYVLFSADRERPMGTSVIASQFSGVLSAIGILPAGRKSRAIVFHALRHSFITWARSAGLSDFAIQGLAGHKSSAMMDRYSHAGQVLDFEEARRRLAEQITGKPGKEAHGRD